MPPLELAVNLTGHDPLYDRLIKMHEGLSEQESHKANAKLILLLANHIGDRRVFEEAIERVDANMKKSRP